MKKILSQVVIFLGLAGFFFLILNYTAYRKIEYVLSVPFSKIDKVSVKTPATAFSVLIHVVEGERVYMLEDGGQVMTADPRVALAFLARLLRLEYVEKFSLSEFNSPADVEALGLGSRGKVTVQLKADKFYTLDLGNDTPSGTEIYVRSSVDPDTVYTVSNASLVTLLPGWMDLRYRLAAPLEAVEKIDITMEGKASVAFVIQDGQWRADGIAPDKAGPLMAALKSLKYENYHDLISDDQIYEYGLANPDGQITLTGKNGAQVFPFSIYNGRYYMLMEDHGRHVLVLNPDSGTAFFRTLSAARP